MMGKIVFLRISILLVVWVPLAVVAVANKRDDSNKIMENKMKTISTICSTTNHPNECQNTLANIAHNTSSNDPMEYIKAAILATAKEIKKAYNLTDTFVVDVTKSNGNLTKMTIDECKNYLQMASNSLQESYSRVEESDMATIGGSIGDIRAWLSAVISLQGSCLNGLEESDLIIYQKMEHGLDMAHKLTSNSIAIFDAVIELPNKHDLQVKVQSKGRRLLVTTDQVGSD